MASRGFFAELQRQMAKAAHEQKRAEAAAERERARLAKEIERNQRAAAKAAEKEAGEFHYAARQAEVEALNLQLSTLPGSGPLTGCLRLECHGRSLSVPWFHGTSHV